MAITNSYSCPAKVHKETYNGKLPYITKTVITNLRLCQNNFKTTAGKTVTYFILYVTNIIHCKLH